MSIDFGTNLNTKFGPLLPTPFIENIQIGTNGCFVRVALYFDIDEYTNENFDDYLDFLASSNMRIYGLLQMDTSDSFAYTEIVNGTRSVLRGYESQILNPFDVSSQPNGGFVYPSGNNLYYFGSLDASEWDTEELTSKEGRPIKKLSMVMFLTYFPSEFGDLQAPPTTLGLIGYLEQKHTTHPIQKLGLITFATTLSEEPNVFMGMSPSDFISSYVDSPYESLFNAQISNVAYCTIMNNGTLATPPEAVYVDAGNRIVDNPIQSINSVYYKGGTITLADIVAGMSELVGNANNNEELEAAFNGLSAILSLYGHNSNLLVRLNNYRKAIPDTSSVTPVGNFYNAFKIKLFNANNAVQRGEKVRKQLVSNPRVQDIRTKSLSTSFTDIRANINARAGTNYADGKAADSDSSDTARTFIYFGATKVTRMLESVVPET